MVPSWGAPSKLPLYQPLRPAEVVTLDAQCPARKVQSPSAGSGSANMSKDQQRLVDYLSHILQAIERIDRYCDRMDKETFLGNELVQDAVVRNLEIIGEAAPSVANNEAVRLVWLTFWDTDHEDGDAVRVDSGIGYTRTVNLTKQPLTMAIPIARGVPIKLKGIRDGEGGGITVGMASGNAQATLPIMSTGQLLALKVVVP